MRAKVVVVTGASAGVGRATVREFARRGARLGLIARGRERLEATDARSSVSAGKRSSCLRTSRTPRGSRRRPRRWRPGSAHRRVDQQRDGVGLLPRPDDGAAEYRRVTEVTYLGVVRQPGRAAAHAPARPRGHRPGRLSAGHRAIPLQSAYCAAKHAVAGFTESLRAELLHDQSHVHVTIVHLPALNTPQFEWARSRLPRRAQPVPPIFQPEVAARAMVWASRHARREVWVGGPTVKAIIADKVAPSLADRYLARTGYAAQQTGEPANPDRGDNLWQPAAGDYAAHGRFDHRARDWSGSSGRPRTEPCWHSAWVLPR